MRKFLILLTAAAAVTAALWSGVVPAVRVGALPAGWRQIPPTFPLSAEIAGQAALPEIGEPAQPGTPDGSPELPDPAGQEKASDRPGPGQPPQGREDHPSHRPPVRPEHAGSPAEAGQEEADGPGQSRDNGNGLPGRRPPDRPILPPLPPDLPRENASCPAERYAMISARREGAEVSAPGELLVCFSEHTVTCLYRSADGRLEWRCEREFVEEDGLIAAAGPASGTAWTFRTEDGRVTGGTLDLGCGLTEVELMREKPTSWWRWLAELYGRCPMPLGSRPAPDLPEQPENAPAPETASLPR